MSKIIEVHCRYDKLQDPAKLKPHPHNPRTHPIEEIQSLAAIIQQTGWRRSITISKRSGYIVRGHGALAAAKLLGCKVPVEIQNFRDEAEEHAHIIADNRLAELAGCNDEELGRLLENIDMQIGDIKLTGFDNSEMDRLFVELNRGDQSSKPRFDKAEELLSKWNVKQDQIWEIGEHRLLCGDALDADSWRRLGGPFNFCFADPPYELHMSVTSLKPASRRDLLFMSSDGVLQQQNVRGFRQFFCYTFNSADSPMWTTVPWRKHTLIGWWNWLEIKHDFKGCASWINHDGQNQDAKQAHDQAKPVELPGYFVRWFSKRGEHVADAFSGSGSMIVAAHQQRRIACSVEREPRYVAVALDRLANMGLKPRLLET